MNKIRRINLFGCPGSGKSTIASKIFAELKICNISIELVNEWIKILAYEGRIQDEFIQFLAFAKQLNKENRILPYVDLVVTDSPLLLNVAYSKKYNCKYWQQCQDICHQFDEKFPTLNILLDRAGLEYQTAGRYENEIEAKKMDNFIKELLDENKIDYTILRSKEIPTILNFIKTKLGINNE